MDLQCVKSAYDLNAKGCFSHSSGILFFLVFDWKIFRKDGEKKIFFFYVNKIEIFNNGKKYLFILFSFFYYLLCVAECVHFKR